MDFEDIVDMDWFNSHTIESSPVVKEELFIGVGQELLYNQPNTIDYPKEMLVMPSTEQIKQLIEIAKRQLTLPEQPTPEPDSPTIQPHLTQHNTLQDYAAQDGIDIKTLSSKERRQLRNKISARNFRVRRKEYITSLEGQVNQHKLENEQLLEKFNFIDEENKKLKLQIDSLKYQNIQLSKDILGSNESNYSQDSFILVS